MKFRIGEIAILLADAEWPDRPECDCSVVAPARLFRPSYKPDDSFALKDFLFTFQYEVIDEAGEIWLVAESGLRKKKPPSLNHDVSTWDECPWQPATVDAAGEDK